MSLDKSRIPKLIDSSRKFIPKKQRKSIKNLLFFCRKDREASEQEGEDNFRQNGG